MAEQNMFWARVRNIPGLKSPEGFSEDGPVHVVCTEMKFVCRADQHVCCRQTWENTSSARKCKKEKKGFGRYTESPRFKAIIM